jgi:hypothetical protein
VEAQAYENNNVHLKPVKFQTISGNLLSPFLQIFMTPSKVEPSMIPYKTMPGMNAKTSI